MIDIWEGMLNGSHSGVGYMIYGFMLLPYFLSSSCSYPAPSRIISFSLKSHPRYSVIFYIMMLLFSGII